MVLFRSAGGLNRMKGIQLKPPELQLKKIIYTSPCCTGMKYISPAVHKGMSSGISSKYIHPNVNTANIPQQMTFATQTSQRWEVAELNTTTCLRYKKLIKKEHQRAVWMFSNQHQVADRLCVVAPAWRQASVEVLKSIKNGEEIYKLQIEQHTSNSTAQLCILYTK